MQIKKWNYYNSKDFTPNIDKTQTNAGIHKQFCIERFEPEEQRILRKLSSEWYLTSSGSHLNLAKSEYDYFLMKPTSVFTEMFNIEREIIVVFSSYPRFEPRALDAFDKAQRQLFELRVETVCRVLISKDPKVENLIEKLLKTDPEQPVVIPFTYSELLEPYNDFFLRNKFRKHFYSRDLFSFLSPLKKDLYFFGRNELILEIVNKHRSGEHTGLFGLRKSGKTSIIYAIERHLTSKGESFLSIDCELPSIHMLRWNELLEKLVHEFHKIKKSAYKIQSGQRYDEKHAADSFMEDILGIYSTDKSFSVLILFDEIERISPYTGSSSHWRNGLDFIYFWQTLRGFYQRYPFVFTYMLVGTNPNCVELPVIYDHENPLFSSIPSQYVPIFTVEQVKQMVSRLGHYMGLIFDELIFSKLTEDLGGHPFLIRQMCSSLHKSCKGNRPAIVDKALYEKVKKRFLQTASEYLEMILQVLMEWYPDEYDMLRILAEGDIDCFTQFAIDNQRYTKHLIGYGLVQESNNGFAFSIEAIREFLMQKHKYERIKLNEDEKLAEISQRRNRIEKDLRTLVKNSLCISYGKRKAAERLLESIPSDRRKKFFGKNIDALLDRDKSELFFLELVELILREWSIFDKIFDFDKNKASVMLYDINRYGRPDAHAKEITDDDFSQIRLYFNLG